MSTKLPVPKPSKREIVFVEVVQLETNSHRHRYDVVRACCRYEEGRVAISVFPGFDVRPLKRGADLPCDSQGVFHAFRPKTHWSQEEIDRWGHELQAGLLEDVRNRVPCSLAWKMVLDVCIKNSLKPKEKTSIAGL